MFQQTFFGSSFNFTPFPSSLFPGQKWKHKSAVFDLQSWKSSIHSSPSPQQCPPVQTHLALGAHMPASENHSHTSLLIQYIYNIKNL